MGPCTALPVPPGERRGERSAGKLSGPPKSRASWTTVSASRLLLRERAVRSMSSDGRAVMLTSAKKLEVFSIRQ